MIKIDQTSFIKHANHRTINKSCFYQFISLQCLEKFSGLTHQVSCNLDIFMRVIHDTEFPNSVDATQKLLNEQGAEYERLKVCMFFVVVFLCGNQ